MKLKLLISLSITSLFFSCGSKVIEMKNLDYENKFFVSQQDTSLGALTVGINVDVPIKYYNSEVMDNIRKQIIAKVFSEQYTNLPVDSVIPAYVNKLKQKYYEDYNPDFIRTVRLKGGPPMDNEIQIEGVAMFSDDKFLSYSNECFAYMGGAHGITNRYFYNFNLSDASLITEKDIFVDDYQPSLIELLKDQIMADNAEAGSTQDLQEMQYWEDRIKPNNNFYFSEEGLVYVFNAYEIAPYSVGQTEVALAFEKLKPILKQENKIAYLYTAGKKSNKKDW